VNVPSSMRPACSPLCMTDPRSCPACRAASMPHAVSQLETRQSTRLGGRPCRRTPGRHCLQHGGGDAAPACTCRAASLPATPRRVTDPDERHLTTFGLLQVSHERARPAIRPPKESFGRPGPRRDLALLVRAGATGLGLGEHARLVGELEALVAENPLRERLRAQLMLALYRSGRHADALAVFRDARARLDGELALEPSRELRTLKQAILTHVPPLAAPVDSNVSSWRRRRRRSGAGTTSGRPDRTQAHAVADAHRAGRCRQDPAGGRVRARRGRPFRLVGVDGARSGSRP
jgi:Bacterial transcriptional activator domain